MYPTNRHGSLGVEAVARHVPRGLKAILALALLAGCAPAFAIVYTVGNSQECTHSSIAAALTAAENHAGADTIRITRDATYAQQAITFTTSQEVTITGGYADCATTTEDSTYTILDGAGGAHASVLTITGNAGSLVHLRKLTITGGDVANNGIAGGGIYYTGNGLLDIADISVSNNVGAYGGGINVGGTGDASELDIGPNTAILQNTAYYNGGGIYSNNIETVIRGDDIRIAFNSAPGIGSVGGFGGGIHIRACAEKSIVYLGSTGLNGFQGVVSGNDAVYGGGIAIEAANGCTQPAELRMFSIDAAKLTSIDGNSASLQGGGIYVFPGGHANAYIWNASIENNDAPVGAAFRLRDGADIYFNEYFPPAPPRPNGWVDCTVGMPCGQIRDNLSSNGQVIYGESNNTMDVRRIAIVGNEGSELIRVNDFIADDTLIADNISSLRLVEAHTQQIHFSTIAGNTVNGPDVLGINTGGAFYMSNSIVWQPGVTTLHNDGGAPVVTDLLASESASLFGPGNARIVNENPRFIDASHGDYRPTAGSPAVDFAVGGAGTHDLWDQTRGIDLDLVANRYGAGDLGAYERQAVQPLVENGNFAANAYIWQVVTANASSWDATQNAPGSVGGSLHVNLATTATSITARVQCIHLPGPGDYLLNGWGKSTGSAPANLGDHVSLGWELRINGSETCTGNPDQTGGKLLATTSAWNRPSTPSHIIVTPAQWTRDTSIAVYLVVDEGPGNGGINGAVLAPDGTSKVGWFDDVTLTLNNDVIFKNGFDGP